MMNKTEDQTPQSQNMEIETNRSATNNDWLKRIKFLGITLLVIGAAGISYYGACLSNEYQQIKEENDALATTVRNLTELSAEKLRLSQSIDSQQRKLHTRYDHLTLSLGYPKDISDFPIRDGEHVYYSILERENGLDIYYFAPPGKHKLRMRLGQGLNNLIGKYQYKTFDLFENRCGKIIIQFENVDDKCVVEFRHSDDNNQLIDTGQFDLPKRTARGRRLSSRSGKNYYLPGDARLPWFGNWQNSVWHWFNSPSGMHTVNIYVAFTSEVDRYFVGIENVQGYLEMPEFGHALDELLEPGITDNRLILTPKGSKMFQLRQGSYDY